MHFFTLLTVMVLGTACNIPVKRDIPKEKVIESNIISTEHPKLIKTIGSPRYGNVQCSLQDKDGNLWFGTTENGIYKYDGKSFSRFLVADGLYSNSVYALLEDEDGKIWIGTQEGLCLYDPAFSLSPGDKTFTKIKIPLPPNPAPNKDDPYYSSNWVYSIMQANSGKIWLVTRGGVYIYDALLSARAGTDGNEAVGHGKSVPNGQPGFTTFSINEASNGKLTGDFKPERILEDKEGYIWFGGRTNEGVYRYDDRLPVGQGKSVTYFKLEELFQNGPKPKPHNWGWPQLQDKNGNIWFSNWGGAYRFDGKSFTSFTPKDGLPGIVTRIIEDKKGTLWFGGDGLNRYDGNSFTSFTTKDGLGHPGFGPFWKIKVEIFG
jgi:ligand-binding sensor domain-containing protein